MSNWAYRPTVYKTGTWYAHQKGFGLIGRPFLGLTTRPTSLQWSCLQFMTETSYGAETHCVETSIFNRAKSELTGLKYVN